MVNEILSLIKFQGTGNYTVLEKKYSFCTRNGLISSVICLETVMLQAVLYLIVFTFLILLATKSEWNL